MQEHIFKPTEFGGDTCEICKQNFRHEIHERVKQEWRCGKCDQIAQGITAFTNIIPKHFRTCPKSDTFIQDELARRINSEI